MGADHNMARVRGVLVGSPSARPTLKCGMGFGCLVVVVTASSSECGGERSSGCEDRVEGRIIESQIRATRGEVDHVCSSGHRECTISTAQSVLARGDEGFPVTVHCIASAANTSGKTAASGAVSACSINPGASDDLDDAVNWRNDLNGKQHRKSASGFRGHGVSAGAAHYWFVVFNCGCERVKLLLEGGEFGVGGVANNVDQYVGCGSCDS